MSTLDVTTREMPTAPLGPCSPLPMLAPVVSVGDISGDVPGEIVARSRTGSPPSLLPYLAQDDYGRDLAPQAIRVAVLENHLVRATIALDLGGRLLSLYDRFADRELFYVNPVVQPANLALRNAWCSGGVEWNIGTRGHSPTTMDTLYAARVDGPRGEPMLRLWEWERLREVVFQVDIWLPDDRPALLVRPRVRNVNDAPVPMYWWTNAAVVTLHDTRVLAPANRAFRTEYPNGMRVASIPDDGDGDTSFPARQRHAADYFFDLAPAPRPWIAAINGDGSGVAHVSTERLRGRKLFVWGTSRGGPRWQQWLSHHEGSSYAEIQAGLAPTQFEHVTMPARAEWAWTEAFGAVAVDPARSHGADWNDAVAHVGTTIDDLVSPDQLEGWHRDGGAVADRPPAEMLATGSGWGALERRRRRALGAAWFDDAGTPFPDSSLGPDQQPWLDLLQTGAMPAQSAAHPPSSYVIGSDWDQRLADAPPTWLTDYHRGTIAHGGGDLSAATERYESSIEHEPNAWAMRGLAEAAQADGRHRDAARFAVEAARMAPGEWRLAAEAVARLLDDERPGEALALIDDLPDDIRGRGRIRLLEAWAALGGDDTARAEDILGAGRLEIADLREGERSIDQLWIAVFPDRELPENYDFRMV